MHSVLGIKGHLGQNCEQKAMLNCLIQLDSNDCLWASMARHGEKVMKTENCVSCPYPANPN